MAIRIGILIALLVASGFYARNLSATRVYTEGSVRLETLTPTLGTWISREIPLTETVAQVLDADVTLRRLYRNAEGAEVWLFMAYFAQQQVNSQIHSPRHCVPGSGWTIVSNEETSLEFPSGSRDVSRMYLDYHGTPSEMVYWFQTRSGTVTGEYSLKWDLVMNSFTQKPTDALFIRFNSTDPEAMYALMDSLDPEIHGLLQEIGLK